MIKILVILMLLIPSAALAGSVNKPGVRGQPIVCIHGTLDTFSEQLEARYALAVRHEMTEDQFTRLRGSPKYQDSKGTRARWWSLRGAEDVLVVMADDNGCAKWRWNIPIKAFEAITGAEVGS